MKLRFINASVLLSILLFLFACEEEQTFIIPKDKMIDILVDIHVADGVLNSESFAYDKLELRPENYYGNVLAKHEIDRVILDSALNQYSLNRDLFIEMYETVIEKLRTRESYLHAKTDKEKEIQEELGFFYYSFSTDYETSTGLKKTIQNSLTKETSKSGKYSYKVNGEVYSQVYKSVVAEPIEEIELELSCYVKFDEILETYPNVAFSLEKDGEIISSQNASLSKFVNQETNWKEIKVKSKLSLKTPESALKVRCFFYNKYKSTFYIDDYFVKITQLK